MDVRMPYLTLTQGKAFRRPVISQIRGFCSREKAGIGIYIETLIRFVSHTQSS